MNLMSSVLREKLHSGFEKKSLSRDAKVILDLIDLHSSDESSLNLDNFDYPALSVFLNKETLELPDEWLSDLPHIYELVRDALKKLPMLSDFNFPHGVNTGV